MASLGKRPYATIKGESDAAGGEQLNGQFSHEEYQRRGSKAPRIFKGSSGGSRETAGEFVLPYKLLFPRTSIGLMVGKNGATVKEIQNASGAFVKLQKESEEGAIQAGISSEKVVAIIGTKEQKDEALKLILEKILPVIKVQNVEGKETIVVMVPFKSVSLIIGTKGQRIQELCKNSNCDIQILKEEPSCYDAAAAGIQNGRTIAVRAAEIPNLVSGVSSIYELLHSFLESGKLSEADFSHLYPHNRNVGSSRMMLPADGPLILAPPQSSSSSTRTSASYGSSSYNNSSADGSATFSSSPPNAHNLLLHPLASQPSTSPLRFIVGADCAAWLVGKSGAHIKGIKQQTGAEFTISECSPQGVDAAKISDKDRVLTVKGNINSKYNVLKVLVPTMEMKTFNAGKALRVLIPSKATSYVIGMKGCVVKQITGFSNATVQVDNCDTLEGERLVHIKGTPEAKATAAMAVLQKLEEYDNPDIIGKEGLLLPICLGDTNASSSFGSNTSYSYMTTPVAVPPNILARQHTPPVSSAYAAPVTVLPPPTSVHTAGGYSREISCSSSESQLNGVHQVGTRRSGWSREVEQTPAEVRLLDHIQKCVVPKTASPQQCIIELLLPKSQAEILMHMEHLGASSFSDIAQRSGSEVRLGVELNNGISRSVMFTGTPMANSVGVLLLQERLMELCKPR